MCPRYLNIEHMIMMSLGQIELDLSDYANLVSCQNIYTYNLLLLLIRLFFTPVKINTWKNKCNVVAYK